MPIQPRLLKVDGTTKFQIPNHLRNKYYFDGDDEGYEIRSSTGVGIDWLTPIGPLNFSFATAITKADSDKTETFRFNIGTSF